MGRLWEIIRRLGTRLVADPLASSVVMLLGSEPIFRDGSMGFQPLRIRNSTLRLIYAILPPTES